MTRSTTAMSIFTLGNVEFQFLSCLVATCRKAILCLHIHGSNLYKVCRWIYHSTNSIPFQFDNWPCLAAKPASQWNKQTWLSKNSWRSLNNVRSDTCETTNNHPWILIRSYRLSRVSNAFSSLHHQSSAPRYQWTPLTQHSNCIILARKDQLWMMVDLRSSRSQQLMSFDRCKLG